MTLVRLTADECVHRLGPDPKLAEETLVRTNDG